jgi:hypothetical protein
MNSSRNTISIGRSISPSGLNSHANTPISFGQGGAASPVKWRDISSRKPVFRMNDSWPPSLPNDPQNRDETAIAVPPPRCRLPAGGCLPSRVRWHMGGPARRFDHASSCPFPLICGSSPKGKRLCCPTKSRCSSGRIWAERSMRQTCSVRRRSPNACGGAARLRSRNPVVPCPDAEQ